MGESNSLSQLGRLEHSHYANPACFFSKPGAGIAPASSRLQGETLLIELSRHSFNLYVTQVKTSITSLPIHGIEHGRI
jgi:hypothetical protein